MMKRISLLVIMLMFVFNVCSAESWKLIDEDLYLDKSYTEHIKNEHNDILKVKLKGVAPNNSYIILIELLNKDTKEMAMKVYESYDSNGNLKLRTSFDNPVFSSNSENLANIILKNID